LADVPRDPTPSEQWFDEYLLTHGNTFEVEPDLGVSKRPDRVIDRAGVEAVCEVKEFTTDALQKRWSEGGSRVGSFGSSEWLLPVRRTISAAADQLEPLASDGRPLVIVLANPEGVAVDVTGPKLLEAMYGNLGVTFEISETTGGAVTDPEWTLGEDGRLVDEPAPWVSAVVGLRRGDRRQDWERKRIEAWKAKDWPRPMKSSEDTTVDGSRTGTRARTTFSWTTRPLRRRVGERRPSGPGTEERCGTGRAGGCGTSCTSQTAAAAGATATRGSKRATS
jgi:hypothetical protein